MHASKRAQIHLHACTRMHTHTHASTQCYLQTGLEGTGHDVVMRSSFGQHTQVCIEHSQVHSHRNKQQHHNSCHQLLYQTYLLYDRYTTTISCFIRHMLHDRYTATISCLIRHITWQIHSNQQLPDQTHLLYDRYTATHSRPNNWTWISLFFKNISTCICLLLEKGVYPENLHVYLCCPINISILINLFCVRILFRMLLLALNFVSDFFFLQLFYQTHLGCGKYTAAS